MVNLFEHVKTAKENLQGVAAHTPCSFSFNLSDRFGADIFLKREDLQQVRSYKIRGAYNKISSLSEDEKKRGIVCASAGNHAQGVAYSCKLLNIKGTIYMPATVGRVAANYGAKGDHHLIATTGGQPLGHQGDFKAARHPSHIAVVAAGAGIDAMTTEAIETAA